MNPQNPNPAQPSNPPEQNSPSQKPSPEKKSFPLKILFVLLIILIVIAIGTGTFMTLNSNSPGAAPTPTPAVVAPAPTADYQPTPTVVKTYSISKNQNKSIFTNHGSAGFSFEYSSLNLCCNISGPVREDGSSISEFLVTLGKVDPNQLGNDSPFDGFSIYIIPNENEVTLEQYLGKQIDWFNYEESPPTQKVEVNELSGYSIVSPYWNHDIFYFIFPDQKNFLIFSKLDKTGDSFQTEFLNILSTFKFTDQTACTLEAKLCPDGSYVSRQGPNCEFAPCPGN